MSADPISPELALVDPELGARARAGARGTRCRLACSARHAHVEAPVPAPADHAHRAYPFWARVTAALWLLVLGILVGGAAIPHAQDTPRVDSLERGHDDLPAGRPGTDDARGPEPPRHLTLSLGPDEPAAATIGRPSGL